MVWRTVTPVAAGDTQRFGGSDINKIMQLLSGFADVDTVDMNSNFKFRSGRMQVANPANTNNFNILGAAIGSPINLTLPNVTADDSIVSRNSSDVLTNKDLSDGSNILYPTTGVSAPVYLYNGLHIWNQAKTFKMTLVNQMSLTTPDKNLTFPSIGSDATAAFLEGTQTFSGTKTFSAQLNVARTATPGSAEILTQFSTSDDASSYFRIQNGASVDNEFAPLLFANVVNDSALPATSIITGIAPGIDTGLTPVINITGRRNDLTNLTSRPVFRVQNNSTVLFTIGPTAINFNNSPITGLILTGVQGMPISGHAYGGLTPNETDPGDGILRGLTIMRPDATSIVVQPSDTYFTPGLVLTTLGATQPVGFYKNRAICYPDKNPRLRILAYLTAPNQDHRFYCGWVDYGDAPLPETDFPLDSITAGILIGFRSTDPNWMVFSSDGEGSGVSVLDTGVARTKTFALRDFELKSIIASNKWTINPVHIATGDTATAGVPLDVTSSVPGTSIPLYFHCEYQSQFTDTARQMLIFGLEIEVGTTYGGLPA